LRAKVAAPGGRGSNFLSREIMVAALENKREAMAPLCRKYGVVRMDVFGSVLRDDHDPGRSDVDLLVDFDARDPYAIAEAYFDMLDERRELLGGPVDLVMVGAIKNPYILADIETSKQVLYAA
jgi:uncharacterized protein